MNKLMPLAVLGLFMHISPLLARTSAHTREPANDDEDCEALGVGRAQFLYAQAVFSEGTCTIHFINCTLPDHDVIEHQIRDQEECEFRAELLNSCRIKCPNEDDLDGGLRTVD